MSHTVCCEMQNICQIVVQLKVWDCDVEKSHSLIVAWICMDLSSVKREVDNIALLLLKM